MEQLLNNSRNSTEINNQEFFENIPKPWLLFYMGVLPIYLYHGWDFEDQNLISQINTLESYLHLSRTTKGRLRELLEANTDEHRKRYFNLRKKYFEHLHHLLLARTETLIMCCYEIYQK